MDRKNHPTKSLLAAGCLVSLCALFCLLAGCEEGMVDGPEVAAAPDMTETAGADLEAVAKAVENTFAETSDPEPEKVAEQEAVVALAEDTAKADPVAETLAEAGTPEPEPVVEQEPVVALAVDTALTDPVAETLAEAGTPEPEPVTGQEPGIVFAEDTAKADPTAAFFAETVDPEPETLTEEQALADLEKKIGLKDPIPTESLELPRDQADPAMVLDKIHIADALLLAANGTTLDGQEEIQVQEQEVVSEAAKSKGFFAKFFVTPGSAVIGFAGRHFVILGAAVFCVVAWVVIKRKKLLPSGPRRKTN